EGDARPVASNASTRLVASLGTAVAGQADPSDASASPDKAIDPADVQATKADPHAGTWTGALSPLRQGSTVVQGRVQISAAERLDEAVGPDADAADDQ